MILNFIFGNPGADVHSLFIQFDKLPVDFINVFA